MRNTLASSVFLVGFMGAGKTSVARRLARMCGIACVDADTYLERREGRSIKDIFADEGEDGFRCIETAVLRELIEKEPLLISCGGGVVERQENCKLMREAGFVVHLDVKPDEAAGRISDHTTRPLFQDIALAQQIAAARAPIYAEVADITIDTAHKSVGAIARELQEVLTKKGILCPQQR